MNSFITSYVFIAVFLFQGVRARLTLNGFPSKYKEYIGIESVSAKVIFTCDVESDSPFELKLFRNGLEINSTTGPPWVIKHPDESGVSLYLWPFSLPRAQGVYECKASNGIDESLSRKVKYIAKSAQLLTNEFPKGPKFPKLQYGNIYVGGNITLYCNASGKGANEISWFLNHIPISKQRNLFKYQLSNGNTKLVLYDLGLLQNAVISCYIANDVGILQIDEMIFSTIQPTPPPTIAPPPGTAPIIIVKPANISVDGPEQTIDFDCQATGQPAPKFSWKDQKGYIKQNADDGKLQFYVMESGSVTCFAENYEGVDMATAYFNVKPIPFRPYEVKSVPDEMTQTSFSFVIYPNPAESDYHSKIPITYAMLETKPYVGLEKQYLSGSNLIKINIDSKPPWKHTIKELLPWTQLYLRVRLGNMYGLGNPSKWNEFYTKMAPLDQPVQNLKNVALSKKSFTLSWEDPERLNGKVSHYEVSLRFEPTTRWLTYKVYDYQKYYKYDWEGNTDINDSPIVHWKVQIVGLDGSGPISIERVFRVAIGAPGFVTNLSVLAFGSRHVRLYWNATDDVGSGIIAYNIEWRKKNSLNDWQNEWQTLKSMTTDNLVDVNNLKPNQEYQFRVIPESSTSLGVSSKLVSAKTLTDSPTSPPQNVRGFATRAESIEVFWEEPEPDHQNGNITGYKIYFTRKIGRQPLYLTAGGNARSIYLQGLSKFTQYSVWVVAFNEKGDSPPSAIFELYTKEKVPEGAPQSVQAQALNDTFIAVTWLPPLLSLQNGRIFGYKVYYRKHKDTAEFGEEYHIKLYGDLLKDAIIHESISADQDYRINVAAFTVLGDGFKSANIFLKTPPKLPSAPSVQIEIDYTTNKVTLVWRPATNFVKYYKIEYGKSLRKYDMVSHKKGKLVASDIRKSLFDDLDSGVWYCFMVSGDLGKHDGWTATTIVWEKTSDGVPSSAPLYLEGITESSSSVKLQWEKPDPWKCNGIIIGYYIEYKGLGERHWRNKKYTSENDLDVETFLLTDLTASTRYQIRVRAFTRVGNGPFSEEIEVMTSQEVLPIVSKLRVSEFDSTSAYIHWSDPVNTIKFKFNLKFIIIYTAKKLYRGSNGIVESFSYNNTITIFAKQLRLESLLPCTTYGIIVKVETEEAGIGDPVTTNFTTVCKAPTVVPVPYLNTSVQTSNTIPLQIFPASNIHGLIDHYKLFVIDIKTSSVLSSSIKSANFDSAVDGRYRRHINNTENSMKPDFYIAGLFSDDELPKLFQLGDGFENNYVKNKLIGDHYYSTFLRAYVKISTGMLHTDSEFTEPFKLGLLLDVGSSKLPLSKNQSSSSVIIIGAASAGALCLFVAIAIAVLVWKRNHGRIYSGEDSKLLKKKSKRSFRNPKNLADPTEVHRLHCNSPGMISHPPINIETLSKHVKNLKLDNGIKFIQEFESIQSSEKYSSEVARLNVNLSKNRYPNVIAYDETRVKLECPSHNSSDYINANYIDGYCKQKAYIATQGPMKNTINDFWLLCWEQNVQVIVMVTKLEERGRSKCEQYWPDHGSEIYGSIKVELKSELKLCNDCIRTFEVSSTVNGEFRIVKHYQYLQWPDPGVPSCPGPVLAFVRRVHSFEPPGCGPTVVHCSAGVGRSKSRHNFCCLDADCYTHKHLKCIDLENKISNSTVSTRSHIPLNIPATYYNVPTPTQNASFSELHCAVTCGNSTSIVQTNTTQSSRATSVPKFLVSSESSYLQEDISNGYCSDNSSSIAGALNNFNYVNNKSSFKLPNNGTLFLNSAHNIDSIVSSLRNLEGLLLIPLKSTKEVSIQTDSIESLFYPKQMQVACVQTELKMGEISECDFNIETTAFPDYCSTEGLFECLICGDDFVSKTLLQEHNIEQHSFFCDKCDHVSNNAIDLLIHKNMCGKTNLQMICQDCEEVFISLKKLNQHRIKTHKVRMPFRCGICSTPFEHHSFVLDHISVHEEIVLEFKCRYCSKNFQTADALSKHYVRHKSVKVIYECRFCKIVFDSNQLLIEHVGLEHVISDTIENVKKSVDSNFTKEKGDISSKNLSSLNNFVKNKRLQSKYKGAHICNCCMLIFKSSKFLTKHEVKCIKKNVDVESFSCDVCSEFFISDALKKQHFKIHHKRLNGYRCIKCFKIFKTWVLLKDHTERVHTKISCIDCGEMFLRMIDLNSHKLIHKKLQNNECDSVTQTLSDCHKNNKHSDLSTAATDVTSHLSAKSSSLDSTPNILIKSPPQLVTNDTSKDLLKIHNLESFQRAIPKTVLDKNIKFICSICDKVTKTSFGLKLHHDRVHGKKVGIKKMKLTKVFKKRGKCLVEETNNSSVASESDQKVQELNHKNVSEISKSSNCQFQLIDSVKVTPSKNISSDLVLQQHKCLICNKIFSNYRGFSLHFRKIHNASDSVENQSTSSIGTGSNLTTTLLNKRLPYVTLDNKISLDCPKCERTFARKKALITHMLTRHQIMEKNHLEYWPNGIPKVAVSASNCTKCKKKFSYKGAMVKHLYECKGRRSFIQNSPLLEQENVEHVPKNSENALCVVEGVKGPPACFICDRSFNTKRDLILHEFKVHGIRWMGQKRILPKKVRNLPKINEYIFPKGKKKRKIADNETVENKRKRLVVKHTS